MRKSLLVSLYLGMLISAQSVSAADLLRYYADAMANDAQYAAARAALQAGQEKLPQGRAGLLPQVNFSANSTQNRATNDKGEVLPEQLKKYDTNGYSLSLSQPLVRIANWQQYEQSKLAVALAEAQFTQAQQELILRVAQAYFDILTAQDSLTFIGAQKAAISEQLASAKRNFEIGTATITDTNEAQARYDLTVAQEIAARNELDIRRAALQQIIGKPPESLTPLKAGVRLTAPQPLELDTWVVNAEKENVSVIQQRINHEITQRQVAINRAAHYPTLDLVANRNHNQNPSTPALLSNTVNSVGVQLSIPLYSGGAVQSKVREALALQDQAEMNVENARRSAAQGTRQAFFGVNSGLAQVLALEAAERSSQSALDSNKVGYQVGVRVNIDVLNAQQQLYSTRRDLAKARYDTLMSGLKLKAAVGTLNEQDVAQINALLQ